MITYLTDVPDFSKLKKVLLVKLRHLGDVLLMTPVIGVLKKRYPHLEIDLVVNEEAKSLVEGIKELQRVIGYKRSLGQRGLFSKIRVEVDLLAQVRKGRYDAVINLTEGDKGNLLALVSGARLRVGKEGSGYAKWLSHTYKKTGLIRHSVERDLDVLRRLGIYPEESEKKLLIARKVSDAEWTKHWLKAHELERFYVLHPVSRWLYKSPQASVFKKILENIDLPCVVTGHRAGNEGRYLDEILKACPKAVYFPSDGSIGRLTELIDQGCGIITVDSLPLHIASSLKKPTVALFGPTSEHDWGPWKNPHARVVTDKQLCRACYKDGCGGGKVAECLQQIDPMDVVKAFQSVVQGEL